MNAHPLLRQLLIITFISGAVLFVLQIRFTPYFPVFIRIYTDAELNAYRPIFTKKCHLPKWLAANGTLLLISLAFLGVFC